MNNTELAIKTSQLHEAQQKFGDDLPELNYITVEPSSILLDHGYTQEDVENFCEEYIFTIDDVSMWSGYLTGLITEYFTDYDYESGVFERPYDQRTIDTMIVLNRVMHYYNDRDWDRKKADLAIKEAEQRLTLVPKIIKALKPFEYSEVVKNWLAGETTQLNFYGILEEEEDTYGKESRQELATAIDDIMEETGLSYEQTKLELEDFNGVTLTL